MSLHIPELDYSATSFGAGFLDTPDEAQLERGATPIAANCLFTSPAPDGRCKLAKRTGARLVNPTAMTADVRVDQLYEYRREGVAAGELLAVCNGTLYRWDGASSFTSIAALGYAAGAVVRFSTFRNLCFITDGITVKVYDGTSVFGFGFAAPTAPPAIAVAAGPGVTGTYQSLATWYDSVHDHESSPTAAGTATVFSNQQRQHTKPAGAPPAQVDTWRIYVRRTDTNEVYFKLVASVAIGTGSTTEAMTDTARNLATNTLAPLPNANDIPPAFAILANAKGYRFGVTASDSFVHVSALGDPQSQHPRDKFGIARGDGQEVTTVKAVGTRIIVQKRRSSYELLGDRMPFIPDDLNTSLGNHSQDSSVEAAGRYWCWDTERGPYVTDLQSRWESLVDGRINDFVATVNRSAEIRCVHFKTGSLICWLVARGATTRLRTLLAYNYLVGAWLPPMTGIEYASVTTFQLTSGEVFLYVGDQWGRVYRYFVDDVEGVPSGTLTAPVTAATASTVTAAGAAFYTTGQGLKGLPVGVVDAAGNWQIRTIQSNTATQITIDTINASEWSTVPNTSYTVVVGPIDWYWTTPLLDFGRPMRKKKGRQVYAEVKSTSTSGATLIVRGRLDDTQASNSISDSFALTATGGWGTGLWGTMTWGSADRERAEQRLDRSFYAVQLEISNRYPNQAVELLTFGVTADWFRKK